MTQARSVFEMGRLVDPPARYLTEEQLLARWENVVVVGTLRNWRSKTNKNPDDPKGPAFVKFGTKVRYPVEAIEAYERANFNGQAANDSQEQQQA